MKFKPLFTDNSPLQRTEKSLKPETVSRTQESIREQIIQTSLVNWMINRFIEKTLTQKLDIATYLKSMLRKAKAD